MKPAATVLLLLALCVVSGAGESEVLEGSVKADTLVNVEGPAVESSSLKPNRIQAKMRQLSERLALIYQRYLDTGGTADGRLSLEFDLGDDGYVKDCRVAEERLDDDELVDCLLENAATWYILPNRDEDNPGGVTITYTFDFSHVTLRIPVSVEPLNEGEPLPPMRRIWWIHKDLEGRIPQINEIYNVYLLASPGLEGEVKLGFILRHDGRVEEAELIEESVGAAGLVNDIITKVEGWRLSSLNDYGSEGDVRVVYTFTFTSAY